MQGLTEYIAAISITVSASTFDDGSIAHKTFFEHLDKKQVQCLAENIYFEAKNQGTAGWAAVASVTLNRVKDYRYPNTVCEVVKQGPTKESWKTKGKDFPEQERIYFPIRHKCQFSWYCDGKSDTIRDKKTFEKIYKLSEIILSEKVILLDITDGATHYHADYVFPAWRKTKTKTVEIGDHIFYRWEK
jgi:spore germination cell wall hydrolase CwlJ-like protein|tara:strand:+ start:192 stop:755 length:564 start_codon:yes stop_codon:yes gene_type:complete